MTPAEFNVMKILWHIKRGSVADVRAEHNREHGSDLAYTTVMTLLNRLAAKGGLRVDKSRQPFLYRPAFRRDSVLRDRLRHFLDTVFEGNADSLVLHLVEDESLTVDELGRIERSLRAADDDSADDDSGDDGEDQ
jgi:BlaI family penicillinase repressor